MSLNDHKQHHCVLFLRNIQMLYDYVICTGQLQTFSLCTEETKTIIVPSLSASGKSAPTHCGVGWGNGAREREKLLTNHYEKKVKSCVGSSCLCSVYHNHFIPHDE